MFYNNRGVDGINNLKMWKELINKRNYGKKIWWAFLGEMKELGVQEEFITLCKLNNISPIYNSELKKSVIYLVEKKRTYHDLTLHDLQDIEVIKDKTYLTVDDIIPRGLIEEVTDGPNQFSTWSEKRN